MSQHGIGLRKSELVRCFTLFCKFRANDLDLNSECFRNDEVVAIVWNNQEINVARKRRSRDDLGYWNEWCDQDTASLPHAFVKIRDQVLVAQTKKTAIANKRDGNGALIFLSNPVFREKKYLFALYRK